MIVLLQRVLEAQVVRRAEGGQAEEPLGAVDEDCWPSSVPNRATAQQ